MSLIDDYIDASLDGKKAEEMHAHARECEKCSSELEFAKMLRDTLRGIDDNITPPLAAQAAWRNAVKAEARTRRMRKIYKYCGTVAAALVVTVGSIAGIRAFDKEDAAVNAPAPASQNYTFVEADGNEATPASMARTVAMDVEIEESIAAYGGETGATMSASAKITAEDTSAACDAIISIAAEYDGSAEVQNSGDSSAYVTAYIPAGSIEQFIESLAYAGEVTASQITGEEADTVMVTISIKKSE